MSRNVYNLLITLDDLRHRDDMTKCISATLKITSFVAMMIYLYWCSSLKWQNPVFLYEVHLSKTCQMKFLSFFFFYFNFPLFYCDSTSIWPDLQKRHRPEKNLEKGPSQTNQCPYLIHYWAVTSSVKGYISIEKSLKRDFNLWQQCYLSYMWTDTSLPSQPQFACLVYLNVLSPVF